MAGPITRAEFISTLLRLTALGSRSQPDHLGDEGLAGRVVEQVDEPEAGGQHVDLATGRRSA